MLPFPVGCKGNRAISVNWCKRHGYMIKRYLNVTRMPNERLPKMFSMENCRKESARKVAKINATKTPLKPRLRTSIFQLSPEDRLHRIEQSDVALSTSLKQRESVTLKESAKNGKQEPRCHPQTRHSPSSYALFANDSLELKLT